MSTELYQSLIVKLITVLELTQKPGGVVVPQAKQALLQAVRLFPHLLSHKILILIAQTNEYKNALAQARELAASIPGGELVIEEQNEVIQMLEEIRDRKK